MRQVDRQVAHEKSISAGTMRTGDLKSWIKAALA
jgi:hypothetical protein